MTRTATALRRLASLTTATLLGVSAAPTTARALPEPKAPANFVALRDVDPTIIQEMRYYTVHDFVGAPIDGYEEPMCILAGAAAQALHKAQTGLLKKGYSLKVYDCYRPQRAVDHFVRWAEDLDDQKMKAEFYPRVDKSRLFADGYIARRSGHSRGSTVDLTVVQLPARPTRAYAPGERLKACHGPEKDRFPDNSVDMGTGFDCFDTLAHTDDPRVKGAQRSHRDLLRDALTAQGFVNLPEEWWHYTHVASQGDEFLDFPVSPRSLTS
ncbi:M15 family metallopeptidase [Streptomyces sp. SID14478]|uniref:M15 family metallopeptidase n=1 Tax=Streptomyces sp. SID14478 TaxID=2706073 RepID=UPI0013DF7A61|nr:M15 family metallopeptidase [Streptomyces sp. SID14478]NEB82270.1 M15 family metallopeptidase [Streptomyces sp. SID14478]